MKVIEAKNGLVVACREKTGVLVRNQNGWDVKTESECMQSVDLSEWNVLTDRKDRKIK